MTRNDETLEQLRQKIGPDLSPVRPLRSAWSTALVVIPLALFTLSVVLIRFGARADVAEIDFWTLWGPAGVMLFAAYIILGLALRQRAPEASLGWTLWLLLPAAAIAFQIGGFWLSYQIAPHPLPDAMAGSGANCFRNISFVAVPPVLAVLWLLSRGLPMRPKVAGFLGGMGGGLISEAIYRLHCPVSELSHVVPWHTGSILVAGVLGMLIGTWWERTRLNSWELGS